MIRLTLPHWYGFTEGVRLEPAGPLTEEEWGRLRERDTAFGFGRSRDEWIAFARSNHTLVERAAGVAGLLARWGATRLVSVGAGTGIFEFLLKSSAPDLRLRCGDWDADSVPMLRERLTDVDSIERMDRRRSIRRWASQATRSGTTCSQRWRHAAQIGSSGFRVGSSRRSRCSPSSAEWSSASA